MRGKDRKLKDSEKLKEIREKGQISIDELLCRLDSGPFRTPIPDRAARKILSLIPAV